MRGIPIVLSAPSGVGKSTISRELQKRLPGLEISTSWTTRKPRPGEIQGLHYRFVTRAAFRKAVKKGAFVEWAHVHGERYGTPRAGLEARLKSGADVLLVIDPQGGMAIKERYPKALTIFVGPPTWIELFARLKKHGLSRSEMRLRLANARKELQYIPRYGHFLVNDNLARTVGEILRIIRRNARGT